MFLPEADSEGSHDIAAEFELAGSDAEGWSVLVPDRVVFGPSGLWRCPQRSADPRAWRACCGHPAQAIRRCMPPHCGGDHGLLMPGASRGGNRRSFPACLGWIRYLTDDARPSRAVAMSPRRSDRLPCALIPGRRCRRRQHPAQPDARRWCAAGGGAAGGCRQRQGFRPDHLSALCIGRQAQPRTRRSSGEARNARRRSTITACTTRRALASRRSASSPATGAGAWLDRWQKRSRSAGRSRS